MLLVDSVKISTMSMAECKINWLRCAVSSDCAIHTVCWCHSSVFFSFATNLGLGISEFGFVPRFDAQNQPVGTGACEVSYKGSLVPTIRSIGMVNPNKRDLNDWLVFDTTESTLNPNATMASDLRRSTCPADPKRSTLAPLTGPVERANALLPLEYRQLHRGFDKLPPRSPALGTSCPTLMRPTCKHTR